MTWSFSARDLLLYLFKVKAMLIVFLRITAVCWKWAHLLYSFLKLLSSSWEMDAVSAGIGNTSLDIMRMPQWEGCGCCLVLWQFIVFSKCSLILESGKEQCTMLNLLLYEKCIDNCFRAFSCARFVLVPCSNFSFAVFVTFWVFITALTCVTDYIVFRETCIKFSVWLFWNDLFLSWCDWRQPLELFCL